MQDPALLFFRQAVGRTSFALWQETEIQPKISRENFKLAIKIQLPANNAVKSSASYDTISCSCFVNTAWSSEAQNVLIGKEPVGFYLYFKHMICNDT